MPTISTTIYKKLSIKDKESLREKGKKLGGIKIYEHKELGIEVVPKFVFNDFNVTAFLVENLLWEVFFGLIGYAFATAKKRWKQKKEVRFWITDFSRPFPINIAFTARSKEDVREALSNLKLYLPQALKELDLKKEQILWLSYDPASQSWKKKVI